MSGDGQIRVLIADDQVLVRAGLATLLDSQPGMTVVGQAGTGEEAVQLARRLAPDVVLMDIRMPVLDGLAATRRILGQTGPGERGPSGGGTAGGGAAGSGTAGGGTAGGGAGHAGTGRSRTGSEAGRSGTGGGTGHDGAGGSAGGGRTASPARVIVLTTYDLDEYVYEALRAGACGFLLKHAPPEELLLGVRAAADGGALLSPQVTRRLLEEFAVRRPAARREPRELSRLTPREREVLDLVIRGRSNTEIARELTVTLSTVKTHLAHVLEKLGLRDRVHAVVYGYENGLVEPGGPG